MNEELTGEIITGRTPGEWAELVRADLAQSISGFIAAGQHLAEARSQIPRGQWERWLASDVGIHRATAFRLIELARHPVISNVAHAQHLPASWYALYELSRLDAPVLETAIADGRVHPELERKHAKALVNECRRADDSDAGAVPNPETAQSQDADLRIGDFRDVLPDVEQVDAIITDPPYPQEFLPLFLDLGKHAARMLRPGGVCAVMTGQSYLPQIVEALASNLTYHWTLAYLTPGGQSAQLWHRKVNAFWKPVLVYTNGPYQGDWFGDVCRSDVNDNDKRHHEWGQSESGMADLMERLSKPGWLICDPFLGGGTTAVAAHALGRRFVGCDTDESSVNATASRLAQEAP